MADDNWKKLTWFMLMLEELENRLTALESRPCNCSAASSASSGGTDGSKLGTGSSTVTVSPTLTPLNTLSAPTAKVVANQFCIHCHGRGSVGGEECDCVYVADASSDPVSAAIRNAKAALDAAGGAQ